MLLIAYKVDTHTHVNWKSDFKKPGAPTLARMHLVQQPYLNKNIIVKSLANQKFKMVFNLKQLIINNRVIWNKVIIHCVSVYAIQFVTYSQKLEAT